MRKRFTVCMFAFLPLSMAGCIARRPGAEPDGPAKAEVERMGFLACFNEANRRAPEPKWTFRSNYFVNIFTRDCTLNGGFAPDGAKT